MAPGVFPTAAQSPIAVDDAPRPAKQALEDAEEVALDLRGRPSPEAVILRQAAHRRVPEVDIPGVVGVVQGPTSPARPTFRGLRLLARPPPEATVLAVLGLVTALDAAGGALARPAGRRPGRPPSPVGVRAPVVASLLLAGVHMAAGLPGPKVGRREPALRGKVEVRDRPANAA